MTQRLDTSDCGCKVGRIIAHHPELDLNEGLRKRWRGDHAEEHSLRELERYFNTAILEQRLIDAGIEVLDGEVDNLYRLLSADASKGMKTQAHRRLERDDVNVDELKEMFVSHQTIYRHLRNCLGVEKIENQQDAREQVETALGRITRLQNKSEMVSEDALSRLKRNEILTLGNFDVIINFRVTCDACGTHQEIVDVLRQGGCDCRET